MGLFGWRSAKPAAPPDDGPRIDRDAVAEDVRPDDFIAHAGTPDHPGLQWHGILLNAPRRLVITPRRPDPLLGGGTGPCAVIWGYCMLPCRAEDRGVDHREQVTLVAVDVARKQVFSGRVLPRPTFGSVHVAPPPGVVARPPAGLSAGGPFNPDLVRICGIPVQDADYEVFARADGWRSNVLDVQVRLPPHS
jgi:hypothetical protein